jgi:hypothetical protein
MTGTCPKCESELGWDGPFYARNIIGGWPEPMHVVEALEYKCRTCGFRRSTATKDARTPPPPPPDRESPSYAMSLWPRKWRWPWS